MSRTARASSRTASSAATEHRAAQPPGRRYGGRPSSSGGGRRLPSSSKATEVEKVKGMRFWAQRGRKRTHKAAKAQRVGIPRSTAPKTRQTTSLRSHGESARNARCGGSPASLRAHGRPSLRWSLPCRHSLAFGPRMGCQACRLPAIFRHHQLHWVPADLCPCCHARASLLLRRSLCPWEECRACTPAPCCSRRLSS